MASRALIIAVEEYPDAQPGMEKKLPGTLQAGLDFKAWVEWKWQNENRGDEDKDLVFVSSPLQPGGLSATTREIRRAIYAMKERGRNMTEELFVFFSGHGFSFDNKSGGRADVILASDFESGALSAECCYNLDMITRWFRDHMGPGLHYYFVDACRNNLTAKDVVPPADLLRWDQTVSEDASSFLLQSTAPGTVALVESAFSRKLIEGLKGRGRAKAWPDGVSDRMVVRYDTLRSFVKKSITTAQITSKAIGAEGESDALITVLRPAPKTKCTIEIDGADASDTGTLTFARGRGAPTPATTFTKCPNPLDLEPDDYTVTVRLNTGTLQPSEPVLLDMYDDQVLKLSKVPGSPLPEAAPPPPAPVQPAASSVAEIDVIVPPDAEVMVQDLASGATKRFTHSEKIEVQAGGYFTTLRVNNSTVLRREVEIDEGASESLRLNAWDDTLPRQSIAKHFPVDYTAGPYFSESLGGPVSDPDLDVWLAIIGGGRILGTRGQYSKIGPLPLHQFADEPAGASPVYLLAAFDDRASLEVSVSTDQETHWGGAQLSHLRWKACASTTRPQRPVHGSSPCAGMTTCRTR